MPSINLLVLGPGWMEQYFKVVKLRHITTDGFPGYVINLVGIFQRLPMGKKDGDQQDQPEDDQILSPIYTQ